MKTSIRTHEGRVALVTGAAQGLGQTIALALAERVARVITTDRIVLRNNSIGHAARPTSSCRIPGLPTFIRLFVSTRIALIAENLFLRKQLALFKERQAKPRRTAASFRLAMVALANFFDWRNALVIVKPETFLKWHRTAFKIGFPF
jgi:NAD(P)-dependent dehydrogenase (short-subunit alcohol dehydrogenase family)